MLADRQAARRRPPRRPPSRSARARPRGATADRRAAALLRLHVVEEQDEARLRLRDLQARRAASAARSAREEAVELVRRGLTEPDEPGRRGRMRRCSRPSPCSLRRAGGGGLRVGRGRGGGETSPPARAGVEVSSAADGTTAASRCRPRTRPVTGAGVRSTSPSPAARPITVPPPVTGRARPSSPSRCGSSAATAGPAKEYTLTCDPLGRHAARAGARMRRSSRRGAIDFEPVPADAACTMIYGGPAVATVTGTVFGEPVEAEFIAPERLPGRALGLGDVAAAGRPHGLGSEAGLLGSTSRQAVDAPGRRSVRFGPAGSSR